MKKILILASVLVACSQYGQAENTASVEVPSDDALVQHLSGKRMASDAMRKGSFLNFLPDGVLKSEEPGRPDEIAKWDVQGHTLCLENQTRRSCSDVTEFTEHGMVLRISGGAGDGQLVTGYFVDEAGTPLRDVIAFDGKLARSLFGRIITTEDVNPPEGLKGLKTVWSFDTEDTVTIEFFDSSGFPLPSGSASYNSKGDDLCITPENNKVVCMRVELSGNTVRMTPLQDGDLLEKEATAGTIE
jgi:hypothetical protein